MAGNFGQETQLMQHIEAPLTRIADQLALVSQGIQTQNEILRKLLDEQNSLIERVGIEIANK